MGAFFLIFVMEAVQDLHGAAGNATFSPFFSAFN
jgi:hypothetical protein